MIIPALLLASLASAQLPEFGALRMPPAPRPTPLPSSRVSERHLMARTGRELLVGHADTPAQAEAARALWSGRLTQLGIAPGEFKFESGVWSLGYRTSDGTVLRDFLADERQFPPKDELGRLNNMESVSRAAAEAGLPQVHKALVDLDFLLPTYWLLYKTAPKARPESETRVRVLQGREELDAEVFARAGVRVLQVPKPWLMVYVGREAGQSTGFARTEAALEEQIDKRRAELAERGWRVLEVRRYPLENAGEFKFGAALYLLAD